MILLVFSEQKMYIFHLVKSNEFEGILPALSTEMGGEVERSIGGEVDRWIGGYNQNIGNTLQELHLCKSEETFYVILWDVRSL